MRLKSTDRQRGTERGLACRATKDTYANWAAQSKKRRDTHGARETQTALSEYNNRERNWVRTTYFESPMHGQVLAFRSRFS
jgi:hypothetical protein